MLWHSWGLLLTVLWLAIDLWGWIFQKRSRWKWRFVLGAATTNLLLIGVMGLMWYWLNGKLEDQREDTYKHLDLAIAQIEGTDYPLLSPVTITNGGAFDIQPTARCYFKQLYYESHLGFENAITSVDIPLGTTVLRSGEALSGICNWDVLVNIRSAVACADVFFIIDYSLISQPNIPQARGFRFITKKTSNGLRWTAASPSNPTGLCGVLDRHQ